MNAPETAVETIVQTILAGRKYRAVCPDTVRRIAAQEMMAHGHLKTALKETKSRLHQSYSAFEQTVDYRVAYRCLAAAYQANDEAAIKATCRGLLGQHRSTSERLPILDRFYGTIWAITGLPCSLLDLGCGLNPLTLPWMNLPPGGSYLAFDIDAPRVAFLTRFFALAGLPPLAVLQDVLCQPPEAEADVALLLKTSPTLERQEKGGTLRLLQALNTPFVVVSFAVKSLGGKEKGMVRHYEREFGALIEGQPWPVHKLTFDSELVFVVRKQTR